LNAFLLKSGIDPLGAITDPVKYKPRICQWDGTSLIELEAAEELLQAAVSGDMIVMFFRQPKAPPQWQVFFAQNFGTEAQALSNSEGGIIFCAVKEAFPINPGIRWIAWSFGLGSRILSRSASDPRFGLLAALNMLVKTPKSDDMPIEAGETLRQKPAQFRDLCYRTTAPYFQQTGHHAARDIPMEGFRIDRSADLVAAIGGRAQDFSLARSVLGGRSFRFRADVDDVDTLHDYSCKIVEASRLEHYRDTLPWIDNIKFVEDRELIQALRTKLVELLIRQPVPVNVDAILPDDLIEAEETRTIQYILFPQERLSNAATQNMSIDRIALHVRKNENDRSPTKSLDNTLRFADEASNQIGTATVLECICAEMELDTRLYMAYDGDFYRVDPTFVQAIDQEIAELPHTGITFPCYRGGTEPAYLERIRRDSPADFVVLDRALIRVEGEAGIEASDLVTPAGAMIHMKRKGKSSTLSHLFLQASNSCELLRRSMLARQQLADLVRRRCANKELADAINAQHAELLPHRGEIEVVFAFLGMWRDRTIISLPLFSRISLLHESKRMKSLGFRPSVALISCF
jgi:uncharacterized protein (TIGR04141 family)